MSEDHFTSLGRYEVKSTLGRGAMGDVYLAEDPVIDRKVAIKVVQRHPSLSEAELDALQQRFEREFRLAGSLSHPNIVTIYDVGQQHGSTFVAMEYIRGESLSEVLASGRSLSFKEVSDIGLQIADALDYAHERGVIHRDVKPANIMMTLQGQPKLTDFGIAKVGSSNMTQTGMIIGTPAYMAPEQITGHPVTPRSDQFAFAVILFELLTGQQPFQAENPTTLMYKIVHDPAPDPIELNPDLPPAIADVLLLGLAKNPDDRYPTCRKLMKALTQSLGAAAPDATLSTRVAAGNADRPPRGATDSDEAATVLSAAHSDSGHDSATVVMAPAADDGRRGGLYLGGAVVVALVVAAVGWLTLGTDAVSEPDGPAAPPRAAASREEVLDSPATAAEPDETEAGDGESAAPTGDADPGLTEQTAPEAVELLVTSAPAGARILLDGEDTGSVTPASIGLSEEQERTLRLELTGYDAAGWTVSLDALSEEQRESRRVHFPLTPSTPPGRLTLSAGYPVSLTADGRTYGPSTEHDLALPAGSHDVRLRAPEVFLDITERVQVTPDGTLTLTVPEVVTIDVLAQPSNCKIYIDGREVDFAPLNDLEITVGQHTFLFEWPAPIDQRLEQVESIRRDGQRIFRRTR